VGTAICEHVQWGAWHSRAARIANGIYVDDETWAQLSAIAEHYQMRMDG